MKSEEDGLLFDYFKNFYEYPTIKSHAEMIVGHLSNRFNKKRSCFGNLKKEVYTITLDLFNYYPVEVMVNNSLALVEVASRHIHDDTLRPVSTILLHATRDFITKVQATTNATAAAAAATAPAQLQSSVFASDSVEVLTFLHRCLSGDIPIDPRVFLDVLTYIATDQNMSVYYQSTLPHIISKVSQVKEAACLKVQALLDSFQGKEEDGDSSSSLTPTVPTNTSDGESIVFAIGIVTGLKLGDCFDVSELMKRAMSLSRWEVL
jgi:hypothetical protein